MNRLELRNNNSSGFLNAIINVCKQMKNNTELQQVDKAKYEIKLTPTMTQSPNFIKIKISTSPRSSIEIDAQGELDKARIDELYTFLQQSLADPGKIVREAPKMFQKIITQLDVKDVNQQLSPESYASEVPAITTSFSLSLAPETTNSFKVSEALVDNSIVVQSITAN